MRIVSFACTVGALRARAKSVTRRRWKEPYARSFHAGELIAAFDRSPRFGGHQVAVLRLLQEPYPQVMADMPDSDFQAEGFAWLQAHPEEWPRTMFGKQVDEHTFSFDGFCRWRQSNEVMWVVRFEVVEILSNPSILQRRSLESHIERPSSPEMEGSVQVLAAPERTTRRPCWAAAPRSEAR